MNQEMAYADQGIPQLSLDGISLIPYNMGQKAQKSLSEAFCQKNLVMAHQDNQNAQNQAKVVEFHYPSSNTPAENRPAKRERTPDVYNSTRKTLTIEQINSGVARSMSPEQLESHDDNSLIRLIQSGQKVGEALNILEDRHTGIYVLNIQKILNKNSSSLHYIMDDLMDDKKYFFYNCAKNFDTTRESKFTSYMGTSIKNMAVHCVTKKENYIVTPLETDEFGIVDTYSSPDEFEEETPTFEYYIGKLEERRPNWARVARLYFQDGKSFKEIGDEFKVSRQRIEQMFKKSIIPFLRKVQQ
jgi:RNA polymerase sigma factor (sigma-70 family)